MDVSFDSPDLIQLVRKLESFARRGIPHAARNGLNATAFAAREQWQREIQFSMTLRNDWTRRSIQVTQARGNDVAQMESKVGSVADYMETQEHGGTERKKHKHGVAIPTSIASGEGRGARPRRRLVRRPNRLPSIQLTPRIGDSQKRRNAIAIGGALRAGRKYVFLELEKRSGIFKLSGGKRRPKIDLLWDLTKASVRIPPTRTLGHTLQNIGPQTKAAIQGALIAQLQRHGVARF